jgi:hypothetical protein
MTQEAPRSIAREKQEDSFPACGDMEAFRYSLVLRCLYRQG